METTHYKAVRQFKQTRIISKIVKNNIWINSLYTNMFIWRILVKCKFFFNRQKAIFYIRTVGVYLNGILIKNPYKIVEIGEAIQLPRTYYISKVFFRRFKKFRKFMRRIRSRVFKLIRYKINPNKQATRRVPSWIMRFENFRMQGSTHIQSDYITYTFMVIYKPHNLTNYTNKFYTPNTAYLLRLYNWRYVV